MNYCAECGFKLEGEFKFCPNCGSKINVLNQLVPNEIKDVSIEKLVCKNCGEENPIENSECFSCGVPLTPHKIRKQNIQKPERTEKIYKSKDEYRSNHSSVVKHEKALDNKKILIISFSIVVVFIFALVVSGVFDSGVSNNISAMNEQSSNTGVNLANMEEINQLEAKINANPDDLETTLHLAHLQQDAGLSEKAISNYKKYLAKYPENADARVDMAICFYNLGDNTNAINEMETAIKYQPKHQIAYLNLGIVNLAAKNIETSKDWFKKTVEMDPNSDAGKRAQELLHSH